MEWTKFFAISLSVAAACTKQQPPAPQPATPHSKIADTKTATELPPIATTPDAPIVELAPPMPIPDARCERIRIENERKSREFKASLPPGPDTDKQTLVNHLLDTLKPCLSGNHAVWGLSFVWPPPQMSPLEENSPRSMHPDAWTQHLLLQITRVNDNNDMQQACAKVGAAGPIECLPPPNNRATRSDRTAMPILVFEEAFVLEQLVDLNDDGNDELVVRQNFCIESCFTWYDIWSFSAGHLIPFGPTKEMNIVAIGDFDEDGKVDIATRAARAQVCHERGSKALGTNEYRISDVCFGSEKMSPALMRRNLGAGHFGPPSDEIETEVSGQPDRRGFTY